MQKKGKLLCLILVSTILSSTVIGCDSKVEKLSGETGVNVQPQENEQTEEDDAHRDRELVFCGDDPMSFQLGDEKVKVEDKQKKAKSITSAEWLNTDNLAVTCQCDDIINLFSIYDVQNKKFTFQAYGHDFVWKNEDCKTIVYIEEPQHFSKKKENSKYYVKNYDGKELYSSEDELITLTYTQDGDLSFQVIEKESGNLIEKTIEL